jgi:hypothetical protein
MPYTWDSKNRRYLDTNGDTVPITTIRDLVYSMTDAAREEAAQLTALYTSGDITLDQWQREMKRLIKTQHVASAVAAGGGFQQMTPSDWGWIGYSVKTQYNMLNKFKDEIKGSEQGFEELPSTEELQARAAMYPSSAKGSFNGMYRRLEAKNGANEEKRVLSNGSKHCKDCEAIAAMDWQPILTLPAIGDSVCISNCNCTLITRYNAERDTFSQSFADGAGAIHNG